MCTRSLWAFMQSTVLMCLPPSVNIILWKKGANPVIPQVLFNTPSKSWSPLHSLYKSLYIHWLKSENQKMSAGSLLFAKSSLSSWAGQTRPCKPAAPESQGPWLSPRWGLQAVPFLRCNIHHHCVEEPATPPSVPSHHPHPGCSPSLLHSHSSFTQLNYHLLRRSPLMPHPSATSPPPQKQLLCLLHPHFLVCLCLFCCCHCLFVLLCCFSWNVTGTDLQVIAWWFGRCVCCGTITTVCPLNTVQPHCLQSTIICTHNASFVH